ncbi:TerB family tellurite resistance protein [Pseudomonas sp. ABC1]|uniref:TerB family tellurite resistance protein n=1 Tax=Pseudomonas sp. ABC1 TaxID=2748080 RepID=UPI0015C3B9D4|nr:DnaJ domain-containing protein [Pseudomonas sp. ABC1]QLF92852.1 TerB family tellurite resistance protein [Pseudomonas sp. ABC1]
MFWPITYLGALAGAFLASIPGAILGALLGQALDRHLRIDSWQGLRERLGARPPLSDEQLLFFLLGRLAKSGGRVRESHIQAARREMQRLKLDAAGQRQAIEAFQQGRDSGDGLRALLRPLSKRRSEAQSILQACWRMARAEGSVGVREHESVLLWGGWMGWDSDAVAALDQQRQKASPSIRAGAYEQALRLLGVSASSDMQEVKRAYRRLLSKSHPDKLEGSGATPEQVREATERTRELHNAYALIRERKGVR